MRGRGWWLCWGDRQVPVGSHSQLASPAHSQELCQGREREGSAGRMLKVLLGECWPGSSPREEEAEQVGWEAPGNPALLLSSTQRKHFCLFA